MTSGDDLARRNELVLAIEALERVENLNDKMQAELGRLRRLLGGFEERGEKAGPHVPGVGNLETKDGRW